MKFLLSFVALSVVLSVSLAEDAYQTVAVNLHNQLRAKHRNTPALVRDDTLNANAVKCAKYYAQKKKIDHSCPYKNGAGENLVGGTGSYTPEEFAKSGTQAWYDEIKDYKYSNPGFASATGHFTQLVWKSSTKFGFGVASLNGYTAGVGLYNPHGNIVGNNNQYFKDNVLPLK